MKAEITFSQLKVNPSLMSFFFRKQAIATLEELLDSVQESSEEVFSSMESYSDDLDEIEDILYNNNIEEITEIFSLNIIIEAYRYGLRDILINN